MNYSPSLPTSEFGSLLLLKIQRILMPSTSANTSDAFYDIPLHSWGQTVHAGAQCTFMTVILTTLGQLALSPDLLLPLVVWGFCSADECDI